MSEKMLLKIIMQWVMLSSVITSSIQLLFPPDASTLYISPSKAALFLQHIEDTCHCPTHSEKTGGEGNFSEYKSFEKTGKTKKCEGAFVSFIKSASLSPRLRNIL